MYSGDFKGTQCMLSINFEKVGVIVGILPSFAI